MTADQPVDLGTRPDPVGHRCPIVPQTAPMLPFLLLSTRPDDHLAAQEHAAVARHMEVDPARLVQWRLEQAPLGPVELERYAGIVIGGSPFTASDPADSKSATQVRVEAELAALLRRVVEADFPLLGLCYGVGTLGQVLGAQVDGTFAESLSAPVVRLTDAAAADPLCADLPREFRAFVGHKEAITTTAGGMQVLAASDLCPVQMFRVGEHVRATQFHPELDAEGIRARIHAYTHHGYFHPDQVSELLEMARTTDVDASHRVLTAFGRLYG